jgi:uncharacterized membrane protein YfcA
MQGPSFGFLLAGFLVGIVSGMIGIGGATILVPALVLIFKFSQPQAAGTSIGALVPPIGIFAAIQYWRNGYLDVRVAALIAAGFVFGALAGAVAVPYAPQVWLKRAFATLLVFVALDMMFADPKKPSHAVLPGAIAAAVLWIVYGIRRAFGRTPSPPTKRPPPPGEVWHI